jgi:PAS domain S-box-containing protein
LASEVSQAQGAGWLLENGPRELELLFRAIVFHPSVPILIADNERNYREASNGATRLLGVSRDQIIGHRIDDFASPNFKSQISGLWRDFLGHGSHAPNGANRAAFYQGRDHRDFLVHAQLVHDLIIPDRFSMSTGKDALARKTLSCFIAAFRLCFRPAFLGCVDGHPPPMFWSHGLKTALAADFTAFSAHLRHDLRDEREAHLFCRLDGLKDYAAGILNGIELCTTALWHTSSVADTREDVKRGIFQIDPLPNLVA